MEGAGRIEIFWRAALTPASITVAALKLVALKPAALKTAALKLAAPMVSRAFSVFSEKLSVADIRKVFLKDPLAVSLLWP
jgi:hypothetical protein